MLTKHPHAEYIARIESCGYTVVALVRFDVCVFWTGRSMLCSGPEAWKERICADRAPSMKVRIRLRSSIG